MHRVNDVDGLEKTPTHHGVEIDIRTFGERLILNHEPKRDGVLLDTYLEHFHHGTLIFNPKEEGLEAEILALAEKHHINRFFFLDLTMPMLVKLARLGERRLAVRYSELESLDTCLRFAGLVEWVWIDCFTHIPLDAQSHQELRQHFKLCLVAPELQGHARARTAEFREVISCYPVDAVCTDYPEDWI